MSFSFSQSNHLDRADIGGVNEGLLFGGLIHTHPDGEAPKTIIQMKFKTIIAAALTLMLIACGGRAQDSDKPKFDVLNGPTTAKLGNVAQIAVPEGFVFLDGEGTRTLLAASGEPTSGDELGFMRPTNSPWSVFFQFSDVGYIKDAEKEKLDADALLQSIKEGNEVGNKHRKAAGQPPLIVVGWEQTPKYNPETQNLEWAIRATSEGRPILNYNTRLLGRKGVMEVVLVCDPEELAATLPAYQKLLADHKFQTGESYAEYRPGDKVAKYGLAALVVGGAAVGAAKLGLFAWLGLMFKKFFKVIIVALIAVVAMFKNLIGKILGRRSDQ